MAKRSNLSARHSSRSGAYVVKAAESHPARVASKRDGQAAAPSGSDKHLARALLKNRRGEPTPSEG